MMTPSDAYAHRYDAFLKETAARLEGHLRSVLHELPRIDRIVARAKEPDRFSEKAARLEDDGTPKYSHPLTQIQDQIGARVVVFYSDDVPSVSQQVLRYFRQIEEQDKFPESEWEFGYSGKHYVLLLPRDVVPVHADLGEAPEFFELQIKTLYQHAWSEANHDLGYKAATPLTADQNRRLAYTAAQSWGADRVFVELHRELGNDV